MTTDKNKPIEIFLRDKLGKTYEIEKISKLIEEMTLKKSQDNCDFENNEFEKMIQETFY